MSPLQLMNAAATRALADTKATGPLLSSVDSVTTVNLIMQSSIGFGIPKGMKDLYSNAPRSLARDVGLSGVKHEYSTHTGGNNPQFLVNLFAEKISVGEAGVVLLVGAEAMATMSKLIAADKNPVALWSDHPGGSPIILGSAREGATDFEKKQGLNTPATTYALIENAIRRQQGRSVSEHLRALGELMAPATRIAAQDPENSWFPVARTPEQISTPSEKNRFVGYPYTKLMNSVIQVNQAAAVVLTSVGRARQLGIPEERWVYLHGCADVNEVWNVTERPNLHESPAIKLMGQAAMKMAGVTIGDISFLDIYSCFPSAVQLGRDALGIPVNSKIPLTITGGLAYHGGPGNNYTMHSIAKMVQVLRRPENSTAFGLTTALGWFVTKHSIGIYSRRPFKGKWAREAPSIHQQIIDASPHYTVVFGKDNQPKRGVIIGRMTEIDLTEGSRPTRRVVAQTFWRGF
eukprot:TRINITY_DN2660_c0_g1_i1.p1 TRINITY_DN2660_c0_g1~~TRINITY_DN2660_c0_g1_i1.p1  ORF type:complete len:484 (+),score=81.76 TRINITY_DN2660_c0_g1_i1:72-1454(+)